MTEKSAQIVSLRNEKESPLPRLPADLRNTICALAVAKRVIEILPKYPRGMKSIGYHTGGGYVFSGRFASLLSLTKVSRQLRAETKALPLSINLLKVDKEDLELFVDTLPEDARGYPEVINLKMHDYWDEGLEQLSGSLAHKAPTVDVAEKSGGRLRHEHNG
ncbi:hypothetical protein CC86DRAFT_411578 [Ophiobolus disseminans]|uniref:Uncharacterized protein n=1 Tax=Ophiobolus disseminans TaxID=1469910 RepID=A0A6A6ZJK6_9PLEO|nr:hypothetical protein CC86DRAFT_411578 [Ophiobolus disseminans]